MERDWQLDFAGDPGAGCPLNYLLVFCFLLICSTTALSQSAPELPNAVNRLKQLSAQERWQEVVLVAEAELNRSTQAHSPDLDYYYALGLAHLGRLQDAASILTRAARRNPHGKRFPIELAGINFKQKKYTLAAAHLRGALRIDSADEYANDFLATIYYLENNLEAALKYWNRVNKPTIKNVLTEPEPRVRPALLDSAFAFSPAATLKFQEFLATRVRVSNLQIFPTYRFELSARSGGDFDLIFRSQERNGFGRGKLNSILNFASGLPYQTVYPEFWNLKKGAINFQSMLRWDAQKRRATAKLSAPLHRNAKWRYGLGTDLRKENWDIRPSFTGPAPLLGALKLRREAGFAEIAEFPSGRWQWFTSAEFSQRDYRSVLPGLAFTNQLLSQGLQLKHTAQISYDLLRIPEERFDVQTSANSQLGRIWSQPAHIFEKLQASAAAHWFPRSQGDDYETYGQIRAGHTFGVIPFDELFILGAERDNDLWMRAHIGTRDGRKGSAPIGRNYFLGSWETDKILYSNGLLTLKLGPFLDTGKITDPVAALGSKKWLWDTGLEAKLRVLGLTVALSYGKDLRTGNNAIYTTVGR